MLHPCSLRISINSRRPSDSSSSRPSSWPRNWRRPPIPPPRGRSSTVARRSCWATAAISSGGCWSLPSNPAPKSSKKRGAARACPCGAAGRHKGNASKTVMTALGAVVLWRAYFACRACGLGGYFADRFLGLEGFLTRQATRLICLLGGSHAFAIAERLLTECCGWKVSDERIRQACQAEATRIAGFRAESPAVAAAFADAAGEVEFQTDAAKVNTTGGWRDMKIG